MSQDFKNSDSFPDEIDTLALLNFMCALDSLLYLSSFILFPPSRFSSLGFLCFSRLIACVGFASNTQRFGTYVLIDSERRKTLRLILFFPNFGINYSACVIEEANTRCWQSFVFSLEERTISSAGRVVDVQVLNFYRLGNQNYFQLASKRCLQL